MPEIDTHSESVRLKFAQLVKSEREKMGKGVKEFALLMGFKDHHMQKYYESAKVKIIPVSTYVKFSEVTGMPYQDVIKYCFFDLNYQSEKTDEERKKYLSLIDTTTLNKLISPDDTLGKAVQKANNAIRIAYYLLKIPKLRRLNLYEEILRESYKTIGSEDEKDSIKKHLHLVYEEMLESVKESKDNLLSLNS